LYRIHFHQSINKYEPEELIKVFLKTGDYLMIDTGGQEDLENQDCGGNTADGVDGSFVEIHVPVFEKDLENSKKEKDVKNQVKRFLYRELQRYTGETPDWGILTGVRPVKLAGELLEREGSEEKAKEVLTGDYYLTEEKALLLLDIVDYQRTVLDQSPTGAVGLYIGIPFCPTRCVYCSFPSNQGKAESIAAYLTALHREIAYTSEKMK
jgi:oxygen-independent coproporphyrinogen-3 oxidase